MPVFPVLASCCIHDSVTPCDAVGITKKTTTAEKKVTAEFFIGIDLSFAEGEVWVRGFKIPPMFFICNKSRVPVSVMEDMAARGFKLVLADSSDGASVASVHQVDLKPIYLHIMGYLTDKLSLRPSATNPAFIFNDNASVHKDVGFWDWLLHGIGVTAEERRHFDPGWVRIWYGQPETTHWSSPCDSRSSFGLYIPSYKGRLAQLMQGEVGLPEEERELLLTSMIRAAMDAFDAFTEKRVLDAFQTVGFVGYAPAPSAATSDTATAAATTTAAAARYVLDGFSLVRHREKQIRTYAVSGLTSTHQQHVETTVAALAKCSGNEEDVRLGLRIISDFNNLKQTELQTRQQQGTTPVGE